MKPGALRRRFGEQAELCRQLACLACGGRPCAAHHEPPRDEGGKDKDCVPLCFACHEHRHAVGLVKFQARFEGLDLLASARALRA